MPLRKAIEEFGKDSFAHEVLEECSDLESALKAEMKWIKNYRSDESEFGFNRIGAGRRHVTYKDRIKALIRLPGGRIENASNNFRTHGDSQRAPLRGVLGGVGVAGACLVWVPDDDARAQLCSVAADDHGAFREWFDRYSGPFRLIDGHLRKDEIRDQGLPCLVLDVNAREAAELLATFDPIGALAGFDQSKYVALAGEFNSTNSAVQQLVADMAAMERRRKKEAEELAAVGASPPPSDTDRAAPPDEQPADVERRLIVCPNCHHEW